MQAAGAVFTVTTPLAAGRTPNCPRPRDLRLWAWCYGIRPSCRARVTASVRLAAPSLPSTWLTCFLTVSRVTTSSAGDGLVRPARGQHLEHFQLAAGQRLDNARYSRSGPWPGTWRRVPGVEGPLEPRQAAERDLCGGLAGPLGRDQPDQQRGHRRALVGEDPDVALWAGQRQSRGQGVHRRGLLAAGRQGQRPQRAGLDEAACPVLGCRRRVQPIQQGSAWPGRSCASRTRASTRCPGSLG